MTVLPGDSGQREAGEERSGPATSVATAIDSSPSVERPDADSALPGEPAQTAGPAGDAGTIRDNDGAEALRARLAGIEAELQEVNQRLDALVRAMDDSVRRIVIEEMRDLSGELRHTVSELGRLLVKDLGRLAQILATHRDSIVSELKRSWVAPAVAPDASAADRQPGDQLAAGDPEPPAGERVQDSDRRRRVRRRRDA